MIFKTETIIFLIVPTIRWQLYKIKFSVFSPFGNFIYITDLSELSICFDLFRHYRFIYVPARLFRLLLIYYRFVISALIYSCVLPLCEQPLTPKNSPILTGIL